MLRLLNENDKNEMMESISELGSKVSGSQIVIEKSGEVITANDSAEASLVGLSVFGKSTQDGTPTPTAPVEIVSVENPNVIVHGKNLLPVTEKQWVYAGVTYTANKDGSVVAKGTVNAGEDSTFHIVTKDEPITLPKGTYMLSGLEDGSESTYRIFIYATDWTFLTECRTGEATFTLEKDTDVFVYVWVKRGLNVDKTFYPMIRLVEYKDSTHEPHKEPQSLSVPYTLRGIPVTSGGNYTDANGQQWICDEVDFERGMHIQRIRQKVFDGTQTLQGTWYPIMVYDIESNDLRAYPNTDVVCNYFEHAYVGNTLGSTLAIGHLNELGFATVDELKSFMAEKYAEGNPVIIQYILKTPIETVLTEEELEAYKMLHTNKPNTTIFNDAGTGMAVDYVADHKLYVDNKFAELQALITS